MKRIWDYLFWRWFCFFGSHDYGDLSFDYEGRIACRRDGCEDWAYRVTSKPFGLYELEALATVIRQLHEPPVSACVSWPLCTRDRNHDAGATEVAVCDYCNACCMVREIPHARGAYWRPLKVP